MLTLAKLKTHEITTIYWELFRIIVPIAFATQLLIEVGVVAKIAPYLEPIMSLYGLPSEWALALLTCILVGIWGAIGIMFVLVPVADVTVADITVFSSLLLFAHALPIEQRIIQKTGAGIWITTLLRLVGGMIYAFLLHILFELTGLFSEAVEPSFIPTSTSPDWAEFTWNTAITMGWMFVILSALILLIDILRWSGAMEWIKRLIAPIFRYAGLRSEASELVAIGLLLGVAFGGGLMIKEAKAGHLSPRQIFLSCVFMGFAHGAIEDTLLVVAMGADLTSVLLGRIVFAIVATALIAGVLKLTSEDLFFRFAFKRPRGEV